MRLQELHIVNFKGIKEQHIVDIVDALDIFGANGTGKTSVYDAFCWNHSGKDSLGRTDSGKGSFGIQPTYTRGADMGKIIPKLVTSVITKLDDREFRRELHKTAPLTRCWIDGVPVKVLEYQAAINAIMPIDRLKMLTDVHHVCKKMHWTDRRTLLMEVAGEIPQPSGFKKLLEAAGNRSLDDFKAMIRVIIHGKKPAKGLKEEREDIGVRIDEIQRQNAEYVHVDGSLGGRRDTLTEQIRASDAARQTLLNQESERNQQNDRLNELARLKIERETLLATDTSHIKPLLDERTQIQQNSQKLDSELQQAQWNVREKQTLIDHAATSINSMQEQLAKCRTEYQRVSQPVERPQMSESDSVCPTCLQDLPPDQLAEIIEKLNTKYQDDIVTQQNDLQVITAGGNELSDAIVALKAEREKIQVELMAMKNAIVGLDGTIEVNRVKSRDRLVVIEKAINSDVKPDHTQDFDWKQIVAEIEAITVGESVSEQLKIIEGQRQELSDELNRVNVTLTKADQIQESAARIKELEAREVEISQEITRLEGLLADINRYKQIESELITAAVNGKFKFVQWKLFNVLQNGTTDHTCVATWHGTEQKDFSGGEEIFAGIDIIKTLNAHYEAKDGRLYGLPLFIDEAAMFTMGIDAPGQVIRLIARKSQKTLKFS